MVLYIFYYLQQFPEETKAHAEFILLTSIISVATALFIADNNKIYVTPAV